jgi:hypothetical protein
VWHAEDERYLRRRNTVPNRESPPLEGLLPAAELEQELITAGRITGRFLGRDRSPQAGLCAPGPHADPFANRFYGPTPVTCGLTTTRPGDHSGSPGRRGHQERPPSRSSMSSWKDL